MSMSDPIADLLTRVRNALLTGKAKVDIPWSKLKEEICGVLQREGFIDKVEFIQSEEKRNMLRVTLRYTEENISVIHGIERVSKPSLRVYAKSSDLQQVRSGLGVSVISTSRGLMTNKQARKEKLGGEVLCNVW